MKKYDIPLNNYLKININLIKIKDLNIIEKLLKKLEDKDNEIKDLKNSIFNIENDFTKKVIINFPFKVIYILLKI